MPSTKTSAQEQISQQRAEIVEDIIKNMQKDGLQWADNLIYHLCPLNPTTGTLYKGVNKFRLAWAAHHFGFTDNRWCTFKQIKDNGWHIVKGSKGVPIERWRAFPILDEAELRKQGLTDDEIKAQQRYYYKPVGLWIVFNANQIEGMPSIEEQCKPKHKEELEVSKTADILIDSSRCPVKETKDDLGIPYYCITDDFISIPPRIYYSADEAFVRVLTHEMTHSTSHPDACNRNTTSEFGDENYAFEELIAELGSLFTCANLGIGKAKLSGPYFDNHIAYLKSWMSCLKDNPDYLFKAAAKAETASDYLTERYEKTINQPVCDISAEKVMQQATAAFASQDFSKSINHVEATSHVR